MLAKCSIDLRSTAKTQIALHCSIPARSSEVYLNNNPPDDLDRVKRSIGVICALLKIIIQYYYERTQAQDLILYMHEETSDEDFKTLQKIRCKNCTAVITAKVV